MYRSDCNRIKQILINLVSNAFKFTQSGEIIVTISQIEKHEKSYLKFTVRDTGIGINKNSICKLFNLFEKLSNKNLNACGTGIGLSISKMLVENLGGTIQAESEEGKWTKFTFTVENYPKLETNREETKDPGQYG